MRNETGQVISRGLEMGRLLFFKASDEVISEEASDVPTELARYHKAKETAAKQLHDLTEKNAAELGRESAEIFYSHALLLESGDWDEKVTGYIRQGQSAEAAVQQTERELSQMFAQMESPYMRARAADIQDISGRIRRILRGEFQTAFAGSDPFLLYAQSLTPSELVSIDRSRLLGVITAQGSVYSHTAILIRSMGIPALTGARIPEEYDGTSAILDAENGFVCIDPNAGQIEAAKKRMKELQEERLSRIQEEAKGKSDGVLGSVRICCNISKTADLAEVEAARADGIGLFRTEFLFLGRDRAPDEEEQFVIYKETAKALQGRPVVIRTIDIGADKKPDYLELSEENPALGLRGIRLCFEYPELFCPQLRAILRASAYGNVRILFPMIASVWEIRKAKEMLKVCRHELIAEGVPIGPLPVGIMVETPAAVYIADKLAKEVDFFSIGTNDLTQYLLAADRQNESLSNYYRTDHPAVWQAIRQAAEAGHAGGCHVAVCGEMAADPAYRERFLEIGIDELSVNAAGVRGLRE